MARLPAALLVTAGIGAAVALPGGLGPGVAPTDVLRPAGYAEADGGLAADVLARADVALTGGHLGGPDREDATLLLRDVWNARPTMDDQQEVQARDLLARPTDGKGDAYGDGYRTRARRTCGPHVCVHAVPKGADAPPDRAWVRRVRDEMERVWRREVGGLGYRPPPSDRGKGGDDRFDVYLKDLGSQGLFGYCAPEARTAPGVDTASSYCVLDDDFARSQFDNAPLASLRVTAAHEFFHAVQFGYDVKEDPWLLESTATWMEERVAGGVNDNRVYLRYGQLKHPERPLDLFATDGYDQYGNWVFWEHLTERFGVGLVRDLWDRLAATPGSANRVSVGGLRSVLREHGGLPTVFARYAASNLRPGETYREGAAWPHADPARTFVFGPDRRRVRTSTRIDHLAARSFALVPDDALAGDFRLAVKVSGPPRRTSPAALAVVRTTDGDRRLTPVKLDEEGRGTVRLPFDAREVDRVVLTLANASTRYECDAGNPSYACRGLPLDERERFTVRATVVR